jgi:fructose-bisphosphate aldolase class I
METPAKTQLERTAEELLVPGKGILAADESNPTIAKRFKTIALESTEENRRAYREMLLTTPGLSQFISGVILFDETLRQTSRQGEPFADLLAHAGIVPGIKVDAGATPLAFFPGEKITEGLDGLRERLAEYRQMGARFAKWRAVITIDQNLPTNLCLHANAHALARYAALAQEAGLLPIVEPEVLRDGSHGIERCFEVTRRFLQEVFVMLSAHRIHIESILLKPNMVTPGSASPQLARIDDVAAATLRCMREAVPVPVPGLVFLSGGQSETQATAHLNALNRLNAAPWQLSFSFGRALQESALKAWAGDPAKVEPGQRALLRRAKFNSLARCANYSQEMETR